MSSTDLEGRLVACRARKVRAAKDFDTAENDYHRRLLDGDGRATAEQRRMEGAAANLKAEEDRERVLLAEIEARDAAAKRAAEAEAFAKRQAVLAKMQKTATELDQAVATAAEKYSEVLAAAPAVSGALGVGWVEALAGRIGSVFVHMAGRAGGYVFPGDHRSRPMRTAADLMASIAAGHERRRAA